MEERKLTERESLEVITSMIARTKERYLLGDGNIMLMWGYVTVGVALLVWVLMAITRNPAVNWLWFLICIIGGIATPIMVKKKQRKKGAKTYSDVLTSKLWGIVGWISTVTASICVIMMLKGINAWSAFLPVVLTIVPMAEIAQGAALNEKSLVWGGRFALMTGILTMCCMAGHVPIKANWFIPMFIAAFIAMMIIPGHILNRKASREQ